MLSKPVSPVSLREDWAKIDLASH